METRAELNGTELAGLLEWWVDAGVDVAIHEDARNWLKPAATTVAQPAPAPNVNVAEPSHETLRELRDWLASSVHLPLASGMAARILPHGPENARIMLLSDAPALEDFASDRPIGGAAWALAEKMLAAIGIPSEEAYCASLSCFHVPGTRMSEDDRLACAGIARRHIALASPERLVLFGDGPCRALLGQPLLGARGHVHKIEGVRTIATFHPRWLLQRPSDKAKAWSDLLLLMEDLA